jgi:hypothetical protein
MFRASLQKFLAQNIPPDRELLLVGPSAGYNLEDSFLKAFPSVRALDIDPLSPALWRLCHRVKIADWSDKNYFLAGSGPNIDPTGFKKLRADYPRAHILFCNLLGQLGFIYPLDAARAEALRAGLFALTPPWSSFHEIFSLHAGPARLQEFADSFARENPSSREKILDLILAQKHLKVSDHWTKDFVPVSAPARYFLWPHSRKSLHVVEALINN